MILSTRVSLCWLLVMGFIAASGCSKSSSPPPVPSPQTAGQEHDHQDGRDHDHDQDHDHDHDHDQVAGRKQNHDHSGDHDHVAAGDAHKHPQSYAAAIGKLAELHSAIKDAWTAKDMEKAHGPLHEVGHLLKAIPALAEKATLAVSDNDSVKEAVDELFECFGQIDQQLHGGEGKSYDEVAARINEAMAVLQSKIKVQQE